MREKIARFMVGRNGADELARFESILVWVLLLISIFSRAWIFDLLAFAVIGHMYFRIMSRNVSKRYEENQKYLDSTYKLRVRFAKEKNLMEQRKTNHIYTCPGCGQKIRIPRGKGKIEIDCPKCHTKFIKRS